MIYFVLFVSFVVRTMSWKNEANHKSMLHREEPKIYRLICVESSLLW